MASDDEDSGQDGAPSPNTRFKAAVRLSFLLPTRQSIHRAGETTSQLDAFKGHKKANADTDMLEPTLDGFRRLLKSQFGSCVCGWRRVIDKSNAHRLSEAEFCKVVRDFFGILNAREMFLDMGGGVSGFVQLSLLDPGAASLLQNFYRSYTSRLGDIEKLAVEGDSQRLTKAQFLKRCEPLKQKQAGELEISKESLESVFHSLQLGGKAGVTVADLAWLRGYCDPPERTDFKVVPVWKDSRQDLRPPKKRVEVSRSMYHAGELTGVDKRIVDEFKSALRRNYGGVVTAWRELLDPEGNREVPYKDLEEACAEVGLEGKAEKLWEVLVRKPSTALRLEALEPLALQSLNTFRQRCGERFGTLAEAMRNWAAADPPIVTPKEFHIFCDVVRMTKNQQMLFELLDSRGAGKISMASVDYAAAADVFGRTRCQDADDKLTELAEAAEERRGSPKARRTLRAQQRQLCMSSRRPPEEQPSHRRDLTVLLEKRFGTVVRAWHKQFDMKGAGKISREAFLESCAAVGFHGWKTALCAELGLKEGASVRFRDLAPKIMDASKAFKEAAGRKLAEWCDKREGEAKNPKEASKRGVRISAEVFKEDMKEVCEKAQYEGDLDELVSMFDLECQGAVDTKLLRSFADAKSEDKALPRLLSKHAERRHQLFLQKLEKSRMPPGDILTAKQDEMRRTVFKKHAAARGDKAAKEELLSWLRRKFGSVTKAWRLKLDPDGFGDLDEKEFVEALSNVGFLPPEDKCSDEDVEKGQRLFAVLCPQAGKEDEDQVVSLKDVDSASALALEEFKETCKRLYGSIKKAFEVVDPDGSGTVSAEDFKRWCMEMNLANGIRRLLDYLDPTDSNEVELEGIDAKAAKQAQEAAEKREQVREEIEIQDEEKNRNQWNREVRQFGLAVGVEARSKERQQHPALKAANDLRSKLCQKHGNLIRAWRKALNPSGEDISVHDFIRNCGKEGIQPNEATAAWEGIGVKGEYLTLNQFDPSFKVAVKSFRSSLAARFGSVKAGIEFADRNKDFKISRKEFIQLCYDCQWEGNELLLFEYLDDKQTDEANLFRVDRRVALEMKFQREAEEERRKEKEELRREREQERKNRMNEKKGIPVIAVEEDLGKDEVGEEALNADGDQEEKPEEGKPQDAPPAPSEAPEPQRDGPALAFREHLARRFGSSVQGWKKLDPHGCVALKEKEFLDNVPATGFPGKPAKLWAALARRKRVSLKELDPELFQHLAEFRQLIKTSKGELERLFDDDNGQPAPSKSLSREAFCERCRESKCPKALAITVFEALLPRTGGKSTLSWENVSFLEEQWSWKGKTGRPKRTNAQMHNLSKMSSLMTLDSSAQSLSQMSSLGSLCAGARPRIVKLAKASSLPALTSPKPTWNDRHHVNEISVQRVENTVHRLLKVETDLAERLRSNMDLLMQEMPIEDWLKQQMVARAALNAPEEDEDDDW